jgi:predicted AAA+ superfamily ATPase
VAVAPTYRPRIIDRLLQRALASAGAVLIEGPKASGKTFTASEAARSRIDLDIDAGAREALRVEPSLVLSGDAPQLIDEWQVESTTVWNFVRHEVDRRGLPGQFILTGSAVPDEDSRRHTGAGRFARLRMRPMTLFESGESSGLISLESLLAGESIAAPGTATSVADIADLLVRGGWPLLLNIDADASARSNRDYLTSVAEVDIRRVDSARNDPMRAMRLIRALARNTAQEHKIARLAAETAGDEPALARTTTYDYLAALERLMLLETLPAFAAHLRSRAVLRTAPRTHFVDPSLAAAALGASASGLLSDLNAFGFLFESLVLRDLRVYADAIDGSVSYYRDSDGLEVDFVVTTPTSVAAFEVKLGSERLDEAAANLLRFAAKLDATRTAVPTTLAIITATGFGYTRPDGVAVVPITAFGP